MIFVVHDSACSCEGGNEIVWRFVDFAVSCHEMYIRSDRRCKKRYCIGFVGMYKQQLEKLFTYILLMTRVQGCVHVVRAVPFRFLNKRETHTWSRGIGIYRNLPSLLVKSRNNLNKNDHFQTQGKVSCLELSNDSVPNRYCWANVSTNRKLSSSAHTFVLWWEQRSVAVFWLCRIPRVSFLN